MNNVLTKPSPEGALVLARHASLELFDHALQKYLKRYLADDSLTREQKLANLKIVEDELATMLGKIHEANAPDYKARAESVAKELNYRIKMGKLD